jgi:hypothetical protein
MLKNISIDEEYFDLVPRPTKEERTALKHSIMLEGVKDPIVVNEKGIVLDGHTRFEICQELSLTPPIRVKQFPTLEEEKRYVIESNTNRRQLNTFQKVEVYFHVFEKYRHEAEDNHRNSIHPFKNHPTGGSLKRYSSLIGVGEKRTHMAIRIIEHGSDYLKERCRNDTITINSAYKELTEKKVIKSKTQSAGNYPSIQRLLKFLDDDPKEKQHLQNMIKNYLKRNKN